MPHERQQELSAELDERLPKDKGNVGQQMFRASYFNADMAGKIMTTPAGIRSSACASTSRTSPLSSTR